MSKLSFGVETHLQDLLRELGMQYGCSGSIHLWMRSAAAP